MLPLLFALIRKATEQRSYAARWLLAAFIIGCDHWHQGNFDLAQKIAGYEMRFNGNRVT